MILSGKWDIEALIDLLFFFFEAFAALQSYISKLLLLALALPFPPIACSV